MEIEGNPWFVAADVCRVLSAFIRLHRGYEEVNTSRLKAVVGRENFTHTLGRGKNGRSPFLMISEPGLYKLIMRSDKPVARPFQDWVTREVLPSIRPRNGSPTNPASST